MSLPVDLDTITVTGSYPNIAGQPQSGYVTFDPGVVVTDAAGQVILTGAVRCNVSNGVLQPPTLPCTDNGGLNPSGFAYTVTEVIGGSKRSYDVQLPHTLGASVDLSALSPAAPVPAATAFAADNTWTGANTFLGETVVQSPVNAGDAATKGYVDSHSGVSSVNAKTGAVTLAASDVGALADSGGTLTGNILVDNPSAAAKGTFVGQSGGSEYSNFELADNIFPLDAAGHYWAFSHRSDSPHELWIYNYNGSTYKNVLKLTEVGGMLTVNNTLDDGSGNVVLAGSVDGGGYISGVRVIATGLTGATATSRYVGATAAGSPVSGTFNMGDFAIDQAGAIWVCTATGSPGTWVKLPHRDSNPADIQPLGVQAAGSTGTAADAAHVHPTTGVLTAANNLSDVSDFAAAFDNLTPMNTVGDMEFWNGSNNAVRLPVGSAGQVLGVSSGVPSWQAGLGIVASTGASGYALTNGTGTILSWTAPADGNMHRVMLFKALTVSSAETGGGIGFSGTAPDNTGFTWTVSNGNQGTGYDFTTNTLSSVVKSGSTVTLRQTTALTAGAAKLFAEIWAS